MPYCKKVVEDNYAFHAAQLRLSPIAAYGWRLTDLKRLYVINAKLF